MFKHNTSTCTFTYKKVKLTAVKQQQEFYMGWFLFVSFPITGKQIEMPKVAADPCDSLFVRLEPCFVSEVNVL